MSEPVRTPPFAPFEWLIVRRYLRARRKEGFISVIAGFSFLGIMLGVATLIIVMAVMNGFRKELLDKILGLNGHLSGAAAGSAADRLEGRRRAHQRGAGRPSRSARRRGPGAGVRRRSDASGVLVRGIRAEDLQQHSPRSPTTSSRARSKASTRGRASRSAARLADQLVAARRRQRHAGRAAGRGDADGHDAAHQDLSRSPRVFEIGMSEYDAAFVFMPLPEAQAYFNRHGRRHRDRGLHHRSRQDRRASARP